MSVLFLYEMKVRARKWRGVWTHKLGNSVIKQDEEENWKIGKLEEKKTKKTYTKQPTFIEGVERRKNMSIDQN